MADLGSDMPGRDEHSQISTQGDPSTRTSTPTRCPRMDASTLPSPTTISLHNNKEVGMGRVVGVRKRLPSQGDSGEDAIHGVWV
ncbi:hypothetical protein VSDG_02872 [Cytospora chrysosperma]|uniref:Uncharacterized protein n=1 Tax=Cytospora chrysosperma TaxID=252740 RepID=A0A423WCA4_CYTCH|nr:hypothetical protein VSDG_02872 [Valsa sordida]